MRIIGNSSDGFKRETQAQIKLFMLLNKAANADHYPRAATILDKDSLTRTTRTSRTQQSHL